MRFIVLLLACLVAPAHAADFRSSSSNATAATSLSINAPAGATTGDVLIAYLMSDGAGETISATEAGWTSGPAYNAADVSMTTFYRTLSASPPASYNFTNASTIIGGIIAINPEGGTDPVIAVNGIGVVATDTIPTPVIANVTDPRVFIAVYGCDSAFTVATPPSGMTQAHSLLTGGASWAIAAYYEIDPADVGNITRTLVWSAAETNIGGGFLVSFTDGGGGSGSSIPAIYRHLRQMKQ